MATYFYIENGVQRAIYTQVFLQGWELQPNVGRLVNFALQAPQITYLANMVVISLTLVVALPAYLIFCPHLKML